MAEKAGVVGYDKSQWQQKKPASRPVGKAEQPMMAALRAEHRHIASVMELMTGQLDAIERGELVDTHVLYETMHYMVTWPDKFHHPREDLIYGRVAELDDVLVRVSVGERHRLADPLDYGAAVRGYGLVTAIHGRRTNGSRSRARNRRGRSRIVVAAEGIH